VGEKVHLYRGMVKKMQGNTHLIAIMIL